MEKRILWWDEHYKRQYQGKSDTCPFLSLHDYTNCFKNKSVLEIGPGEGRQFLFVNNYKPLSYSVADISEKVLFEPIYSDIKRFLIENYCIIGHNKFDTIHAWYVLHHVLKEELDLFFKMIKDNLKINGSFLFNYSAKGSGLPDGKNTTGYRQNEIIDIVCKYNFLIVQYYFKKDNNIILHIINHG